MAGTGRPWARESASGFPDLCRGRVSVPREARVLSPQPLSWAKKVGFPGWGSGKQDSRATGKSPGAEITQPSVDFAFGVLRATGKSPGLKTRVLPGMPLLSAWDAPGVIKSSLGMEWGELPR